LSCRAGADCWIAPPDRKLMHLDADAADHRGNTDRRNVALLLPPNLERLPPGLRTTAFVSRGAADQASALATW
jgi:hypothetical protein